MIKSVDFSLLFTHNKNLVWDSYAAPQVEVIPKNIPASKHTPTLQFDVSSL